MPVPWNHNTHHHRLVLDTVPAGARNALDVGAGDGLRRLAALTAPGGSWS